MEEINAWIINGKDIELTKSAAGHYIVSVNSNVYDLGLNVHDAYAFIIDEI